MRLPGSTSFTRSSISIGKRCGRYSSTSLISISAMLFSFSCAAARLGRRALALALLLVRLRAARPAFDDAQPVRQIGQMADHRGIARPRRVLVERKHAG